MQSENAAPRSYSGAQVRSPSTEPPAEIRRSVLGDLAQIVGDLGSNTELIYQLTLRDLRIRYKQAFFGFAWALLIPVAVILAGMAVRLAMAHVSEIPLDRSQVAAMAVKSLPWAFFVGSLTTATPSLLANIVLVTKVYFPREVLPLASVLAQTFDSAIGATILVLFILYLRIPPSIQWLWVPFLLILLWSLVLALSLFLSCANIFLRDVKYIVQIFLMFGIFGTPVFLDAPMFGVHLSPFVMLNPLAPILEGLRLAIVENHNLLQPMASAERGFVFWHPWYLAYTAAWAFGGLILSALFFHRSERRFAELA